MWLALVVSPVFGQSPTETAERLFQGGDYEAARTVISQILMGDPDHIEGNALLGRLLLDRGEFDAARKPLETAVRVDSKNVEHHLQLAVAYREKARRAKFLSAGRFALKWKRELETAFELDGGNFDAREELVDYLLGAPAIGGGDAERAERLALESVEIDEIQGRLLLAGTLRVKDKTDRAIAECRKVLAIDPQNGSAHKSLGYIYLEEEDYSRAEHHFQRYLELAPGKASPHESLGDLSRAKDAPDQAIQHYISALEIDPESSRSRVKLGRVLEKKGLRSAAKEHYEIVLRRTPGHAWAWNAEKRLRDLR